MSETDLQLGGGYTYQWQCGILLALNCFFEEPAHDDTLYQLVTSFLGQVETIHLEGEDRQRGVELEDINLLGAGRRILIQVKTKEREGQWWTPSDPLLRKALYRFYDSHFLEDDAENTRFVFLTNRPFNPALAEINAAVEAGALDQCAEVEKLYQSLMAHAKAENKDPIGRERFDAMLVRTRLVEYLKVNRAKASVRLMLRAYGLQDVDQGYALLYERFSEQSTLKGGGIITVESVIDVLGSPVEGRHPLRAPGPKPLCPYPGMEPFGEEDKDRFFGRRQKVAQLLRQLRSHPFLAIVGPSGSGKSSLVYAGLVPELRESSLFGPGGWRVISLRPGPTPMEQLGNRIGGHLADPGRAVSHLLAGKPNAGRVLLVVDQFEELFTLAREQEITPFKQTLLRLAEHSDCYVVLTVRADFYPHLMVPPLWDEIKDRRNEVLPLDEQGLRLAISRPAEKAGVFVQLALVERLIADAAGEPGILPFVQETLVLLWDRMDGRALSLRAYDELVASTEAYEGTGVKPTTGLQIAMAEHAEDTLRGLTSEQQAIARRIFLRLVQFGEGRTDIRRQQTVSELQGSDDDKALFDRTLARLIESRLLTASGEAELGERTVDLAHEALIAGWPTLQEWLTDHRQAMRISQRLEAKAAEWEELGRKGSLRDEVELGEAERWLASPDAEVLGASSRLKALVNASRRQWDKEQRIWRLVKMALIGLGILVVIGGALAVWQWQTAVRRQVKAQELARLSLSRQLAAQATSQIDGRLDLAFLLGTQAYQIDPNIEARSSLFDAHTRVPVLATYLESARGARQTGSIGFSPAGDVLAEGTWYGTINLWDVASRRLLYPPLDAHPAVVKLLVFAADGKRLASVGGREIRIWDVASGQSLGDSLRVTGVGVKSLAFSPDGSTVASLDDDGGVVLWDISTTLPVSRTLDVASSYPWDLAFSADGSRLFLSCLGGIVQSWDVATLQPLSEVGIGQEYCWVDIPYECGVLLGSTDVTESALSPDGRALATAWSITGGSTTVSIWSTETGSRIGEALHDQPRPTVALAYSADGKALAALGRDSTIVVWNVEKGTTIGEPITAPDAESRKLAVTSTGKVAMNSIEGDLIVWDLTAGRTRGSTWHYPDGPIFLGFSLFSSDARLAVADYQKGSDDYGHFGVLQDIEHGESVGAPFPSGRSTVFDAEGKVLAGISDGKVAVWDHASGQPLCPVLSPPGVSFSLHLDPKGKLLATRSVDFDRPSQVLVWDLASCALATQQPASSGPEATSLAFSPDGAVLAIGRADGIISLWDISIGQFSQPMVDQSSDVGHLTFSPDGRILASAHDDRTIRLWDTTTGRLIGRPLVGHTEYLAGMSFSPDGALLVSFTIDGVAIVWDVAAGRSLGQPLVGLGGMGGLHAAFTPDGKRLALLYDSGLVLRSVDPAAWIERGCHIANRNLSQDEWDQFVDPETPYQCTCPEHPPGIGAPLDDCEQDTID